MRKTRLTRKKISWIYSNIISMEPRQTLFTLNPELFIFILFTAGSTPIGVFLRWKQDWVTWFALLFLSSRGSSFCITSLSVKRDIVIIYSRAKFTSDPELRAPSFRHFQLSGSGGFKSLSWTTVFTIAITKMRTLQLVRPLTLTFHYVHVTIAPPLGPYFPVPSPTEPPLLPEVAHTIDRYIK